MILAAGRGTRLGRLGSQVPKILLELGGAPLLQRQLEYLAREGVTRVVVNAHHRAEQVDAFLSAYDAPVEIVLLVEPELLGTAGGVRNALPHLDGEAFVVLYGDVLIDAPLAPMLALHGEHAAAATLAVYEGQSTLGKGVVDVDERGRVRRFVEKEPDRTGPGLVNAGLYVVEPALVAPLPAEVPLDFGHDVLPAAVDRGERILAHRLPGPVLDIGTPEALELARTLASPGGERAASGTAPDGG